MFFVCLPANVRITVSSWAAFLARVSCEGGPDPTFYIVA